VTVGLLLVLPEVGSGGELQGKAGDINGGVGEKKEYGRHWSDGIHRTNQ